MNKFQGECRCGDNAKTHWVNDRTSAESKIVNHVQEVHHIQNPQNGSDYSIASARKCDSCDSDRDGTCRSCGKDFCAGHSGSSHGYCRTCQTH